MVAPVGFEPTAAARGRRDVSSSSGGNGRSRRDKPPSSRLDRGLSDQRLTSLTPGRGPQMPQKAMRFLNRTQVLVLSFFGLIWIALVVIFVFSPEVYTSTLQQVPGDIVAIELAFLVALSALIGLLVAAVVRRWQWAFWLIVVAFLFGILRLPASGLQLVGVWPATGPTWYEVLQAVIGLIQFLIALAMLRGYQRVGVWGEF
jgi:hypothetical protein